MDVRVALAHGSDKPFELAAAELDDPRPDEVRVRITGVGICHTDLVVNSGLAPFPFPAVLGHEGAGVIDALGGDVTGFGIGDHVVVSFHSCGHCRQCSRQEPAYCKNFLAMNYAGTRPDGSCSLNQEGRALGSHFFGQSSFASHALATSRNIVKVPRHLPLHLLGPLGCGVQTGAGAVMRSLDLTGDDTLFVAGVGAVGLSAVMAARLRGCRRVVVLEPSETRRALALELGATHALDPTDGSDVAEAATKIQPGGFSAALDTSGREQALVACLAVLATQGVLGLLGSAAQDTPLPGHVNGVLSRGQSIRGIIEGDSVPQQFIPELLRHYEAGGFPFDRMIRTYPFIDINRAIADLKSGETVKAVLTMD